MRRGLFITFEGPDGSGKTTQIENLKNFLSSRNYPAIITREPGGTPIGEKIREIILDKNNKEMDYMTEALLYAAARSQHVAQVIKPALEEGKIVICDRFIDSSIVYQGYGRKLGNAVQIINEFAINGIMPDITFLLKIDPKVGKDRIREEELDRLELEKIEYHNEVYKGYIELEKIYPERIIGIDAEGDRHEIANIIQSYMEEILLAR